MISLFVRKLIFCLLEASVCFTLQDVLAQQTISQVRSLPPGSVVTTTGTITTGDEFGDVRYMQDGVAGIALFDTDLSSTEAGDSVLVTGVLSVYRGQLQIAPVMSYQVLATGSPIQAVLADSLLLISQDAFESRRIRLTCAGIHSCEAEFEAGWYVMQDHYGNSSRLLIAEEHPLEGNNIPAGPVIIEGVWTKYEDQYQLLAQAVTNAPDGSCYIIPQGQVEHIGGQLTFTWGNLPGTSQTNANVLLGDEEYFNNTPVEMVDGKVSMTLLQDILEQGKVYKTQLWVYDQQIGFSASVPLLFTMPSLSTPIDILFNRQVDASYSDGSGPLATGSSVIELDLIGRIDQVDSTLDIAMYNTGRASIVDAVERAANRGVLVRYIADDETSNNALDGPLNFPVLFRSGDGIMHNKFVIADVNIPEQAWLWTGSTNLSTTQLSTDPNHAYVIRDQALARSYTLEFDEMWGAIPAQEKPHYGDFKINNTVHQFWIGDTWIESWFSPSDETNCRIIEALRSADHQVLVGLLLLTRFDLADELITLHEAGVDVRVIVDDEESSAFTLARLREEGVRVVTHDPSAIFHHKYAIIDEGHIDSDPLVLTGSHNWTWSADNINDENTLIIHDQSVTNIFRQEFEARWKELVPSSTISVEGLDFEVYPNPASDFVYIRNPTHEIVDIQLFDNAGREILVTTSDGDFQTKIALPETIPAGVYLLSATTNGGHLGQQRLVIH